MILPQYLDIPDMVVYLIHDYRDVAVGRGQPRKDW